jgi:ketosteroid isomerase-like protein
MHPNAQLIGNFYHAFARRDHAAMRACYAPDIDFADEVFTLRGKRVGAMWHMLCDAGQDLQVIHSHVQADDGQGSADWQARYTFSRTKRPVHNLLRAEFLFRDGKIVRHRDHFDFWRWSRMALGPTGIVLGWTPTVRAQVRAAATASLDKFIAAHPEYQ